MRALFYWHDDSIGTARDGSLPWRSGVLKITDSQEANRDAAAPSLSEGREQGCSRSIRTER